jgi:hypothetical protein
MPDIGERIMDLIPDTVPSGTTAWQACVAAATLAREAVAELRAENERLRGEVVVLRRALIAEQEGT